MAVSRTGNIVLPSGSPKCTSRHLVKQNESTFPHKLSVQIHRLSTLANNPETYQLLNRHHEVDHKRY